MLRIDLAWIISCMERQWTGFNQYAVFGGINNCIKLLLTHYASIALAWLISILKLLKAVNRSPSVHSFLRYYM